MKRDYGTLVPSRPSAEEAINHVPKKQRRVQGLEVVFDPHKHRDFITGFRKRKQQRRKEAQQSIKEKERQERLQQRAEKRTQLKQQLGLDDKWGVSSSSESEASDAEGGPQQRHVTAPLQAVAGSSQPASRPGVAPRETRVFKQSGMTTTVNIAPVSMHSSSEEEEEEAGEEEQEEMQRATPAVKQLLKKKGATAAGRGGGLGTRKAPGSKANLKPQHVRKAGKGKW